MKPITHIQMQTTAVFLIVYTALFVLLKEGLDYTYGESEWWLIIVMPPVYFVARRLMEVYQRAAIRNHNKRIEQGRPW